MPQDPAEQNTQYREENQQQANRTANFQPEPAEIEHPEEQQPSVRATTPWQAAWIEELAPTASFDDFDLLVDRLTKDPAAEIWEEGNSGEHTNCSQNSCIET